MPLTRQDIDDLVDGIPAASDSTIDAVWVAEPSAFTAVLPRSYLRRQLYLAAGLTADGQRKPERVHGWLFKHPKYSAFHKAAPSEADWRWAEETGSTITPGWFVPDGEGE